MSEAQDARNAGARYRAARVVSAYSDLIAGHSLQALAATVTVSDTVTLDLADSLAADDAEVFLALGETDLALLLEDEAHERSLGQ